MAFVWDLIQQIQLHNTKARTKSARKDAQTAELRARVAESRSRSAESRARDLVHSDPVQPQGIGPVR